MPEDKEEKKSSSLSFDVNKWLPYIIIFGGWLINWGKDSSNIESLRNQVAADHAVMQTMSDRLSSMSDRLIRVETNVEAMKKDQDQERSYKNAK